MSKQIDFLKRCIALNLQSVGLLDLLDRIEELERELHLLDEDYGRSRLSIAKTRQERDALQADNARLREALEYCVTQVGELATVPGIASALSSTPEQSLAEYRNKVIEE